MAAGDAPRTGLVISYRFLWPREKAHGAEHGRKARPACVVVPLNLTADAVVLFPLTTQEPGPDRLSVRVPDTERRRDVLPGSYHIEPITHDPLTYVYGQFSQAFMQGNRVDENAPSERPCWPSPSPPLATVVC